MTGAPPGPGRILRLANGYWATGILGTAAAHSVFTHLESGARTADDLAGRAGISPRGAQTLLDGLVALELAELHDDGYHNSADSAAFLVEGRPGCLSDFAELKLSQIGSPAALPEVVRAGGPEGRAAVEVANNPHWNTVVTAIAAQSVPVATLAGELLRIADAGPVSILDLGGGSGVYSATWLALNPEARVTQLDWAPINAIARRLLAERGVADRFGCLDGDFHDTDLGRAAYDIVIYSHIAHQEGAEDNIAVLGRIREALKPGGTLVLADYLVDDDRGGPAFALLFGAEMLLKSHHGATWRRADYRAWLAKAGFEDVTFHTTPSPTGLIFARRH